MEKYKKQNRREMMYFIVFIFFLSLGLMALSYIFLSVSVQYNNLKSITDIEKIYYSSIIVNEDTVYKKSIVEDIASLDVFVGDDFKSYTFSKLIGGKDYGVYQFHKITDNYQEDYSKNNVELFSVNIFPQKDKSIKTISLESISSKCSLSIDEKKVDEDLLDYAKKHFSEKACIKIVNNFYIPDNYFLNQKINTSR